MEILRPREKCECFPLDIDRDSGCFYFVWYPQARFQLRLAAVLLEWVWCNYWPIQGTYLKVSRLFCSDGFDSILDSSIQQEKNKKEAQKYSKLWTHLRSCCWKVSSVDDNIWLLLLRCWVSVGGKRLYSQEWHWDTLEFYRMEISQSCLWCLFHN